MLRPRLTRMASMDCDKSPADTRDNFEQYLQAITFDQLFEICQGELHSHHDCHNAELYLMRNPDEAKATVDGMHPLHVACLNYALFSLISALFEAWPESVRERGRSGALSQDYTRLPLHDALSNPDVSLEIIRYLVYQWPESVKVQEDEDMVAHTLGMPKLCGTFGYSIFVRTMARIRS